MRVILVAISLILFISCKNEEYDKLLDENEHLKSFYKQINGDVSDEELRTNVKKQLLLNPELNMDIETYHYYYRLAPSNNHLIGKLNTEFTTNLKFYIYRDIFPEKFCHTFPSKSRNTNEQKQICNKEKYFSFVPKDTGMYYWLTMIEERQDGTDLVAKYYFHDSIYVYE